MVIKCEPCGRSFSSAIALRVHESKGPHKIKIANCIEHVKKHDINADVFSQNARSEFLFKGQQIRAVKVHNDIWFCAKDVAIALEYTNTRDAIKKHVDDDCKILYKKLLEIWGCETQPHIMLSEIDQQMIFINEPGLYSLIFGSKRPLAKEFKKWVASEVLPAIRKNGYYASPKLVNPKLEYVDRHSQEAKALMNTSKTDIIYIYEIHAKDVGMRRVYKYGITYELDVRGTKHRDKYKCDLTLVKTWPIHLSRCKLMQLETSIGLFANNIGLRENYMNSRETFICDESDDESLQKMIDFVDAAIIENNDTDDNQHKFIKMKLDHEYRMAKLNHAEEMMRLNIEMAKLRFNKQNDNL